MNWRTRTNDVDWRVDDGISRGFPQRRLARFAVAAVGLAALLVACAPLALTPAPAPQVGSRPAQLPALTNETTSDRAPAVKRADPIHLIANDFDFDQHSLRVAPGETVTITLENQGTVEHNFHVAGLDTELVARPNVRSSL